MRTVLITLVLIVALLLSVAGLVWFGKDAPPASTPDMHLRDSANTEIARRDAEIRCLTAEVERLKQAGNRHVLNADRAWVRYEDQRKWIPTASDSALLDMLFWHNER